MQKLEETELRKADRTVGLTVIYFPIFRQARPDFFWKSHNAMGADGDVPPFCFQRANYKYYPCSCSPLSLVELIWIQS